jgi:monoterpene epsilon-lactone hydrolase
MLMPEVYSSRKIMLYVHGGSFVGGSRKAWRSFCSSLATACSCRVVVPEFRLPPAFAYPAGLEDVQKVFRALFTEEQVAISLDSTLGKTNDMPEIIVAADGSGASLALALILSLRQRYRSCISKVILFSPWLNVSPDNEIVQSKKIKDEVLSSDNIRCSADTYTYTANLTNQMVSPLLAEDSLLVDFPSVYIQMGEKEILLPDAKLFQKRLLEAGCDCELDVEKDMMFMFQMADEYLAESHLAIERIGKMITEQKEVQDELTLTRSPVLESSLDVDM